MDLLNLFKNYLFSQADKPSKVTVKNYLSDINHFVRWYETLFNKNFEPKQISSQTLNDYRKNCETVFSQSSLDRHFSSLRKFFKFLLIEGVISLDPFSVKKLNLEAATDPWHVKDFKDFLYVSDASRLTIKNYLIDIKQFLTWAGQVTESANVLGAIDSNLVEEYKQRLLNQGDFSPATINRKLSSLRKYLVWAQSQNLVSSIEKQVRPIVEIPEPKVEEVKAKYQIPNTKYSPFPPLRLAQKISKAFILTLDNNLIIHLAKLVDHAEYALWKTQGQPVFTKIKDLRLKINDRRSLSTGNHSLLNVKNIKKEFYAPLEISTKLFPWYKKAWFTARYSRPKWYKVYHSYPIVHYLNFAILIIFLGVISFSFYNVFFQKGNQSPTLAAALPSAPLRILSFQGRLTDNFDNPISTPSALRFVIYNTSSSSSSARLWEEVDNVVPDQDGIFNVLLGGDGAGGAAATCNGESAPATPATGSCGLMSSLFSQNSSLWLGVTVGNTPELTPRQQVATVAFASNAETLQGLLPITSAIAGQTNVVLALNSSGNLTIGGSANPTFQASGGQFSLSGQSLMLTTNAGSNGNVQIAPDELGFIDMQRPIINSSNTSNLQGTGNLGAVEIDDMLAVLATTSGAGITINQTGPGDLFTASLSGTAKFTITHGGGIALGGDVGTNTNCLLGGATATWGSCGGGGVNSPFQEVLGVNGGYIRANNITEDLLLGGSTTASAKFAFINNNLARGNQIASISGSITLDAAGAIQTTNNQLLTVGGNSTGDIQFKPGNSSTSMYLSSTGNVGIGTTNPDRALEINNATPLIHFSRNNGDYNWNIGVGSSATPNITTSYFGIEDASANAARLVIAHTTGNVGIGTTNPTTKLEIGSSADEVVAVTIGTTSSGYNNGGIINFKGASGSNVDAIKGTFTNSPADGGLLEFQTWSGSGLATMMAINKTNVGIGTIAPSSLFSVGSSSQFQVNSTGAIAAATGLSLTSGPITLGGVTGTGLCLIGGATASWSSCSAAASNYWQRDPSGALSPLAITDDLLIGGSTTASAKFAFTGLMGNQTQASFSGQFILMPNNGYGGTIGINTTSPLVALDARGTSGTLAVASFSAKTSFATLVVDNSGVGDLFTASHSGTTKFIISNDGSLTSAAYAAGQNGVLFGTQTSGLIAQAITASTGLCLTSGASSPTWSSCSAASNNYWQLNGNALSPINTSYDLLIGSSSTSSAKFAVLNMNSGTPTATVAGNFIVMPLNNVPNATTGRVGIGVTNPQNLLALGGNAGSISEYIDNTSTVGLSSLRLNSGGGDYAQGGGLYSFGSTYPTTGFAAASTTTLVGYDSGGLDVAAYDANGAIRFFTNGFTNERMRVTSDGYLGIGTTNPLGLLSVSGSTTSTQGQALVQINQLSDGPIFTASQAGTTQFLIDNSGNVGIGTANPVSKLTVNGGIAIGISGPTSLITNQNQPEIYYSASGATYPFTSAGNLVIQGRSTANRDIVFAGGSTPAVQMVIQGATGNVGIGATSPLATLDVRGSSGITPIASFSGNTSFTGLLVDNSGSGNLITASSSADKAYWGEGEPSRTEFKVTNTGIVYGRSWADLDIPSYLLDLSSSTISMVAGGKVGIGMAEGVTPTTALDVRGQVLGTSVIASISGNLIVMSNGGWGGQVGIGTTAPNAKLDVSGAAITTFTGNNRGILNLVTPYTGSNISSLDFTYSGNNFPVAKIGALISASGTYLQFGTSNNYATGVTNTAMTIGPSGNVGIGTAGPIGTLSINSTYTGTSRTANLYITSANNTNQKLYVGINSNGGATTGDYASIEYLQEGQHWGNLVLQGDGGSVGIGTTNPLTKLQVLASGTDNTVIDTINTAAITATGPNYAMNTSGNPVGGLQVMSNSNMGANVGATIGLGGRYVTSDTGFAQFAMIKGAKENSTSTQYDGYLAFGTSAYGTNVTEKMRISSLGNVGIGTVSPRQQLSVGAYLDLYSGAANSPTVPSIRASSANNLVLDAYSTGAVYLNADDGTGGVIFEDGANGNIGSVSSAGNMIMTGTGAFGAKLDVAGEIELNLTGTQVSNALCHATNGKTSNEEIRDCTGTLVSDYAEIYATKPNVEYGQIVATSDELINSKITTTSEDGNMLPATDSPLSKLEKSSSPYQANIVGVTSQNWGDFASTGHDSVNSIDNPKPIALSGRVKTEVSTENGAINVGDMITSSSIPGVGMKATKPGRVVGMALEPFSSASAGTILVFIEPQFYDPQVYLTSTGDLNFVDQTATADANFTTPHYFTLNDALGNPIDRVGAFSEIAVANLRAGYVHAQALTVAGGINAGQITTNTLSVVSENVTIGGQSLKSYIASIVSDVMLNTKYLIPNTDIVSPIATADEIHTNFISPLGNTSQIGLKLDNNKLSILNTNNASGSAVSSFDNQGNASFSGQLTSNSLTTNDATISGTLHAGRILASDIVGLATTSATYVTNVTNIYNSTGSASSNQQLASSSSFGLVTGQATAGTSSATSNYPLNASSYIDISSYSGQLTYVDNLSAANAAFSQNLTVFGQTSLSDTSIIGQLSVGGNLILANDAINVLGSDLSLQPLRQGGLSIMGGLFYIDTDGNVKIGGNADFAKNVTVNGTLSANIISPLPGSNLTVGLSDKSKVIVNNSSNSAILAINQAGDLIASGAGTFSKLNLGLIQPAFAVSPTELVATGSAGTANVGAYQTQVTIDNPSVTDKSLIYITPTSNTNNQVLYLLKQVPGQSFTVGLQDQSFTPIPFNWIIVN